MLKKVPIETDRGLRCGSLVMATPRMAGGQGSKAPPFLMAPYEDLRFNADNRLSMITVVDDYS
jgi:hypothetical protein